MKTKNSLRQTLQVFLTTGALVIALLSGANVALAASVQWTLNNWSFSDGSGSATGSFVYDADLGTFSNVSITSTIDSATFAFDGVNADATTLEFVTGDPGSGDLTGTEVLLGELGNPGMTNAGGTLFILTSGGANPNSSQSVCDNSDCSSSGSPVFLTSGNITGTVVPVPAAVWLFGSALGLLGWLRRMKKPNRPILARIVTNNSASRGIIS